MPKNKFEGKIDAKIDAQGKIYFYPSFWAEFGRRLVSDALIRKLFEASGK